MKQTLDIINFVFNEIYKSPKKARKILMPIIHRSLFVNDGEYDNYTLFGIDCVFGAFLQVQVLFEEDLESDMFNEKCRIFELLAELKTMAPGIQNNYIRDRLLNVVENYENGWPIRHDLMRRRDI